VSVATYCGLDKLMFHAIIFVENNIQYNNKPQFNDLGHN